MKAIIAMVVLGLVAVLGVMAQNRPSSKVTIQCAGRTCTQQGAQKLVTAAQSITSGPRVSLSGIKSISMSSDGSMKCQQKSGQACTAEQARSLQQVAAALNMNLTFSEQQ